MKKIFTVIGVVAVLLLFLVAFFMYKFKNETSKMSPIETQEVITGIYAVKSNYVNFFLVKSNDEYIAIDAGENEKSILVELEKLGINSKDVKVVFLTHTHNDHIAALKLFENATVYVPEKENKINSKYIPIKDSEKIKVSNMEFECIYAPGHTEGSVSYLVDGKYLFSGDTFSLVDGKVQLFNEFFNKDSNKQKEIISKLAKLNGVEYVFTAHYGYTQDVSQAFKQW